MRKFKHIPLLELENRDDFIRRHIGPGKQQIDEMLKILDVASHHE